MLDSSFIGAGRRWSISGGFLLLLSSLFLSLILLLGTSDVVLAADVVPATATPATAVVGAASPSPESFDPLSSGYLLKLVFSLVIVLALMFVVVWLLKRTGRFNGRAGSYPLNVLAQMPVGTRERVVLIAVGDRQMLLGVSQGQIESLGWVDPPLSPDSGSKSNPLEGAFFQLMKNQMPSSTATTGTTDSTDAKRDKTP